MGELEQAKDYHQRALEIRINVLGPNHLRVATSYNNLGSVFKAMAELEQAKDYHQRALEITINVLGRNHIKVVTSYNNLGLVYQAMGEVEKARNYHQRGIDIGLKPWVQAMFILLHLTSSSVMCIVLCMNRSRRTVIINQ